MIKMLPINAWLKEQYLLSSAGDNLIEKRDDGLYYGISAPANVFNLYVDAVSGDDNNLGNSVSAPLRTVYAAIRKQKENQLHRVHLKEGQMHVVNIIGSKWNVDMFSNRIVEFYPYGPTWDSSLKRNIDGTATYRRAKDINRPTLKFITSRKESSSIRNKKITPATMFGANNKLYFTSMIIDTSTPKDRNENILIDEVQPCYIGTRDAGNNQLEFIGCEFKLGPDYGLFGSGSGNNKLLLDCCNILNKQPNQFFVRVFDEGSLKISSRNDGYVNREWSGWSSSANAEVTRKYIDSLPRREWKDYFKGTPNDFKTILANPGFGF